SSPSMTTRPCARSNVARSPIAAIAASSARSILSWRAFHATARYMAPVSMCRYRSRAATARATVPLPAPDGPSMATIKGFLLTLLLSPAHKKMAAVPFFRGIRAILLAIAAVLLVAAGDVAMRTYRRGAAFVVQAAGIEGVARRVAGWQTVPVSQTLNGYTVPWPGGTLKAHASQPVRVL